MKPNTEAFSAAPLVGNEIQRMELPCKKKVQAEKQKRNETKYKRKSFGFWKNPKDYIVI